MKSRQFWSLDALEVKDVYLSLCVIFKSKNSISDTWYIIIGKIIFEHIVINARTTDDWTIYVYKISIRNIKVNIHGWNYSNNKIFIYLFQFWLYSYGLDTPALE